MSTAERRSPSVAHDPLLAAWKPAPEPEPTPRPAEDRRGADDLLFPALAAQEAFWLLERIQPVGSAFHVPFQLRLQGDIRYDWIAESLAQLVARHEALRTHFEETADGLRQVVKSRPTLPWQFTDLSQWPMETALRRAAAVADEQAKAPFDLTCGPLIRGTRCG